MDKVLSEIDSDKLPLDLKKVLEDFDPEKADLKNLRAIDDSLVESLYSFAFGFYEAGKYQEALNFFILLTAVRRKDGRFWKGLGATFQLLKRYPEAVDAYSMAAFMDEKEQDPYTHFHAAECLYSMNEFKRAIQALKSVKALTKGKEKYYALNKRVDVLGKMWKKLNII